MVRDEMLPQLGIEYIDLLLIHWPCLTTFDVCTGFDGLANRVDTWQALEELRADGTVRSIGVSNFHVPQLEPFLAAVEARTGRQANVSVDQVPWSLGRKDVTLMAWAKQRNITLEAYSPLGGIGGVAMSLSAPVVQSIAKKHGVTPAQVIFRWIYQQGIVVVTASTNHAHMEQDLTYFRFRLSQTEMDSLNVLR